MPACEHMFCHQASEARQRAAEHQPRAEEAEFQDYSKRSCFFVYIEDHGPKVSRFMAQRSSDPNPAILLDIREDTEGFTGFPRVL